MRDFGDEGHPTRPPLPVQRALAAVLLRVASRKYVFVDEWDVAAPRDAVFAALADARTYPRWWRPVHLGVDADGEPAVGKESRQHFKGRLPYHLRTRSRITRLEPPHVIAAEVDGDLRGHAWAIARARQGLEPFARAAGAPAPTTARRGRRGTGAWRPSPAGTGAAGAGERPAGGCIGGRLPSTTPVPVLAAL